MRIYEDLRVVQARLVVLQYLVVSLVGLLLVAFWHVQVLQVRRYRALAESNRSRTVSIAAPRGRLLDRAGRTLVENRPSFNIVVTPDQGSNLDETVGRLARALRIGEAQIRERLAHRQLYRPVVVRADAGPSDVAAVEARRLELPETRVEVVPLRSYPLGTAAAHTVGRVGEISESQLRSREFADLEPGDLVGQAGIESEYNRSLMGIDGARRVVVNSRGLEVGVAESQLPVDGPSLRLTLDADLQRTVEAAFEGRPGSAVVLDPWTGEILAMTSVPAYDPNLFANSLDVAAWLRLSTDPATPLMNRVIQGQYPPGSLFKVVMAAAALEESVITPQTTFYCPGYLSIYNTVFRCNRAAGHGVVNLSLALAQSCNVFFYQVGVRLEIDRIARYSKRLGLGAKTGVDLPHESAGLVPSPGWKLRAQGTPWYGGETVSVAIGQGQLTVTPLQMARLAALVANGGRLVQPHLVQAVGGQPLPICSEANKDQPCWRAPVELGLKPETLELVREGMRRVVDEGTGWRARLPGIAVCGKTGSAQVVARARLARGGGEALQPHGWFLCFAPADKPRVALAVLVEHGGSGGEAAAPVARRILARFFGLELPAVTERGARDGEG